jgi:uncharacterized protein (DUF305 family)
MKIYVKFGAMILTSTLAVLGLMYLNTYQLDHVVFSETRIYMALVLGATMTVIMPAYMRNMHTIVRSQATVDDVSYMKAMIPHHSVAIMTNKRAQIEDHRVRSRTDEIIESQNREIIEMKTLIKELGKKKYLPSDI